MSREKILRAIKQNKPPVSPLPNPPEFPPIAPDVIPQFAEAVQKAGGKAHVIQAGENWESIARRYYPDARRIVCRIPDSSLSNTDLESVERLTDLHGLDLAILPAQIGVSENAAVWLTEAEMGQRVVPFIAEHLILLLDRNNIVGNMHEAYRRIEIDQTGFGLFIAGPSKTADIEQSLVIGAQGPRTWVVIIR